MTSIDMPGVPGDLATSRRADGDGNGREPDFVFESGISSLGTAPSSPWNMRVPLLAWLIETFRPSVVVDLDLCGNGPYSAICDAIERLGVEAQCISVPIFNGPTINSGNGSSGDSHSGDFGYASATARVDAANGHVTVPEVIDLLHVQLTSAPGSDILFRVDPWIQRLRPGAVIVVSGQADRCDQSVVWKEINERFPFLSLEEGSSSLAQVPFGENAPLIEELSSRPALRAELSLLIERGEYRYLMGTEPRLPSELRLEIDQMRLERRTEMEAARVGLAAMRREVERALSVSAGATAELASERERRSVDIAAERERVLAMNRDEIDALAAKVAISAARYERRLADLKDEADGERKELERRLLEARDELLEARYEIEQLRSSTSWRITAGLRWTTRVLRRIIRRA